MNEQTQTDGGPAFQQVIIMGEKSITNGGMSLRDYFAAHASEEDIAEFIPPTIGEAQTFEKVEGFWPSRQWARYKHADAMLKARAAK